MKHDASAPLYTALRRVYEKVRDRDRISAIMLANEAMAEIGFPSILHPVGYLGCHMHMRQIARSILRREFDPFRDDDDGQARLDYREDLQERYPRAPVRGEDPVYIKRELMTKYDYRFNIDAILQSGAARIRHGYRLEEEMRQRFGTIECDESPSASLEYDGDR